MKRHGPLQDRSCRLCILAWTGVCSNLSATTGGTYNVANEETSIAGSSVTPTYDAAGNMTTLSSGDTATYDVWNRPVKVTSGETLVTVQRNEYDGTNRRIQMFTDYDANGVATNVEDDYYSGQQVIESYHSTPAGALQSAADYVWSPRYIDSAILRDTYNSSGTFVAAARVLYLADANYNVTGLVKYDSNAQQWNVAERYTYTPYGEVTYRESDWDETTSSANANTTL